MNLSNPDLEMEKPAGDTDTNPSGDGAATGKKSRKQFWIIIGIVALNSIGMSIVLPLLPFLVGKYLPPKQVVVGMSALLSVFAVCTFFAAPILGTLSDRYGRKPILLISVLGSVIGYVMFGIGGALWILFVGRIIDGIAAGSISMLFAIVSDTTKPEERTKWYGYVSSAMSVGKIGGPALGGLIGSIALSLPFYITAGLIFLSSLAVYFLLPESLAVEKITKKISLRSLNTFSHFKEIFSIKAAKYLLIVGLLFYAALGVFQFNFTVFLKDIYKWGPVLVGSLLTVIGVCDIVTRSLLLPWLLKRFREKSIGVAGLVIFAVGLALVFVSAYAHTVAGILAALICIIGGQGLFETTYNGRLSQSVDQGKQGKLQGVNQSLIAANNAIVPLGAAAIYFYSPGMLYATATCIALITIFTYRKYISPPKLS